MRTLLALIERPGHVCYRYRVAAFAPHLQRAGWRIDAEPLARGFLSFLRQVNRVGRAEAVLLQRRLLAWWQLRLLRHRARVLLFDFDDAVFHRDSNSPHGAVCRRRERRFRGLVRAADAILAGNRFLAEEAARSASPCRVHHFPTVIEPARYAPRAERQDGPLRLVWIGSRSTMTSLQEAAPGLLEAARRIPGLELRVICDAVPELPGIKVIARDWSEATEAEELAAGDVGISWLPEHPWSRGKCGLKVLQYMAAGLPVVANPVGVHETLVVPGATGMLPRSAAEWAEALMRLAQNPLECRRLGEDGRRRVVAGYGVDGWGPRLASLLDELAPTSTSRAERSAA